MEIVKKEVEREIVTKVKEPVFILTLSEQEATYLISIMSKIGGSPSLATRKFVNNTYNELNKFLKPLYSEYYTGYLDAK